MLRVASSIDPPHKPHYFFGDISVNARLTVLKRGCKSYGIKAIEIKLPFLCFPQSLTQVVRETFTHNAEQTWEEKMS